VIRKELLMDTSPSISTEGKTSGAVWNNKD